MTTGRINQGAADILDIASARHQHIYPTRTYEWKSLGPGSAALTRRAVGRTPRGLNHAETWPRHGPTSYDARATARATRDDDAGTRESARPEKIAGGTVRPPQSSYSSRLGVCAACELCTGGQRGQAPRSVAAPLPRMILDSYLEGISRWGVDVTGSGSPSGGLARASDPNPPPGPLGKRYHSPIGPGSRPSATGSGQTPQWD
ncbi:hypothetical protein J6590_062277 [Homalodisca vitripennis]|nr:hypothetical protein J6590_062277 [Homalodisca vitripennis]